MSKSTTTPDIRFAQLAKVFSEMPNVAQPLRKGFGESSLWAGKKMFAFLDESGALVLKLPRDRVDDLVDAKVGSRWDPGNGRLQKEWMILNPAHERKRLPLAKEAREYAASLDRPKRAKSRG